MNEKHPERLDPHAILYAAARVLADPRVGTATLVAAA